MRRARSLSSTLRPSVIRIRVAKVGLAIPRSSSLIRWKGIPTRSDRSSWVNLAFVRSSSIASPSALWVGDRGLVRRRGGKFKAAFPPECSVVNRYNVKRRLTRRHAIPGRYLPGVSESGRWWSAWPPPIVALSMSNVLTCKAAWQPRREPSSGLVRARKCRSATGCKKIKRSRQKAGPLSLRPAQGTGPRIFGSTSAVLVSRNGRHRLLSLHDLHAVTPSHLFAGGGSFDRQAGARADRGERASGGPRLVTSGYA